MRKLPKQARSREMVERIVDAARSVLVDEGYDQFTTNRVARRAAVSPGSLYQYFPDKQSLLDVVIDRYWDRLSTEIELSLSERIDEFTPENARAVFDALLHALESDAELLRVLTEELPRSRVREQYLAVQARVRELAATVMILHGGQTDRKHARTRAWIAIVAVENLATRWVLDGPAITRDELLDQAVELTVSYLGVPSPGQTLAQSG